ncbi:CPX chromosomal region candidate gene 1 protein [Pteronotus mesoamericanus]|uniref:CPX chromosomal region candidate gene 1 protein n=1 Tax=Pteronotus mesoamericanus TaxID=1884717 RepID=UPI0023EB91F9|nr:CPX chromosomal region candidate gene 1 protein [Pteronotus parnellii mesoamericanus]
MTSPTKEESDPADNTLKNSDDEAPNDRSTDREPSLAERGVIAEVDSAAVDRELNIPAGQEHAVLQPPENDDLALEKNQQDPQEDVKEEDSHLIEIPVPSKRISCTSGLGRVPPVNIPPVNVAETSPLTPLPDRARCNSGNTLKGSIGIYYVNISYKIPFHFSVSWSLPFTNICDKRKMFLRLVCEGYFSHVVGHRNTTWVKPKYRAFITGSNIPIRAERAIVFRRPLRVQFFHSLSERMASRKMSKSVNAKEEKSPQTPPESPVNKKGCEDLLRVMITLTDAGWKYLCPFCGSTFNSLIELRLHACNFLDD